MIKGIVEPKINGSSRWIRLRGSSDDPESFELAVWKRVAWELSTVTAGGRKLSLYIPDYMVREAMPAHANPQSLYNTRKNTLKQAA